MSGIPAKIITCHVWKVPGVRCISLYVTVAQALLQCYPHMLDLQSNLLAHWLCRASWICADARWHLVKMLKHSRKEYWPCLGVYKWKWCVVLEVVGQHVQRHLLLDAHQGIKPKELAVSVYCCCWASQLSSDCLHVSLFRLRNFFLAGCLKVHPYFQVACIFGDLRRSFFVIVWALKFKPKVEP